MISSFYIELNKKLKKFGRPIKISPKQKNFNLNRYLGTPRPILNVDSATKRKIAKDFLREQKISLKEFTKLLDSLYTGKTFEERTLAGLFIQYSFELRKNIDLNRFDKWLSNLEGWAEVDATCQSGFLAEDVLSRWNEWKIFLNKLLIDKNINKRRASLVLLVKSVGKSDDKRLADLAFKNIEILKFEKEVLITKAISWLLRALIKNHKLRVAEYLKNNKDSLPKIAIREVERKLRTGKK